MQRTCALCEAEGADRFDGSELVRRVSSYVKRNSFTSNPRGQPKEMGVAKDDCKFHARVVESSTVAQS